MTASLYQSGSIAVSLRPCAMQLTFDAQTPPCDHRFIVARTSSASSPSEQKPPRCRDRFHKNPCVNFAYPLIFITWLATHCHSPPRCTQVSVKRNVRSNGLPSLVVPFSCAVPTTTATPGP